ncbi:MAG: EamA family transporter [Syntrophomonadaceae bacterium]|nr:EamA family transporter [Syntrophomonadaceae bacterium]
MLDKYIWLFVGSVFIASCAQIILKISANKHYRTFFRQYINLEVLTGYFLLGLTSLTAIIAFKGIDLKTGSILQCTGYVFMMLLSWVFLKEYPTKGKVFGVMLIMIGIVIFNI